jgi:hypothetical protein
MKRVVAMALLLVCVCAAKRRSVTPGGRCAPAGTLISGVYILGIAADPSSVYYHDEYTNTVWRISKGGGPPAPLLDLGADSFAAMTVDATQVYVAALEPPSANSTALPPARIYAVSKNGGTRALIAEDIVRPTALAADDTHLYWTTGTNIERALKDGSRRETILGGLSTPMALMFDGDQLLFVANGLWRIGSATPIVDGGTLSANNAIAGSLRVRDGRAYFLTSDDTLSFLPLAGGARTTIAQSPLGWSAFDIDSCAGYFTTLADELVAARIP